MTIINSEIKDNVLIINVTNPSNTNKIYIDSLSNRDNIYSLEDLDHTKTVLNTSVVNSQLKIILGDLVDPAYVISIDGQFALAIDYDSVYNSKVKQLVSYCSTCLDQLQQQKIVMIDFKTQLLDYAIKNNKLEDAIDHFISLTKLLNITVNLNNNTCNECNNCANGMCKLC